MSVSYTRDHEYIRVSGTTGTVGITLYAQEQLGDIVFVELPAIGKVLTQGEEAAVVESVKAASEIYAPVSGTVIEVNGALAGDPGLINASPEDEGWIYRLEIADAGELAALMDADAYAELTKST